MDGNEGEYLPVESAGNAAGISPRTLRSWIAGGKLPATKGPRGRLVKLTDVLAMAEMTGKRPAPVRQSLGSAGNPAASADISAGNIADETTVDVSPAARSQLEAIRDEWLQPLVNQLRDAERSIGRLEQERDQLRGEVERLQVERDGPERPQDGPGDAKAAQVGRRASRWWRRLWER